MQRETFENKVKRYVREVHDEYNINVPLSDVRVEVEDKSLKNKTNYGRAKQAVEIPYRLIVNYNPFKKDIVDFEHVKATVRHEWAHIIQMDICEVSSHGETFKWLAERLDFPDDRYENTHNAKYRLRCHVCDFTVSKSKNSKKVKQARDNRITCYRCSKRSDRSSLMNVERVDIVKCIRKLEELAFVESENEEDKDWKDKALTNLQTAKNSK